MERIKKQIKLTKLEELREIVEAVEETLINSQTPQSEIESMDIGDWRYLIEGISENGFNWNEETIFLVCQILSNK